MLAAGFSDVTLDLFFRGGWTQREPPVITFRVDPWVRDRNTIVSKGWFISYLGDEIHLLIQGL